MVMRKNSPSRKVFFWTLFGFFVFLILATLYFFNREELVRLDELVFHEQAEPVVEKNVLACETNQTIEYLYYLPQARKPRNNKFGMYIYAENKDYIRLADELVNSNGGDWGYVLIPYNVRDRDNAKWREVFALLHKRHLIPIIQLHDVNTDRYKDETEDAAKFLDEFVWPVRQRYVSVYNEPNDAKFWYGRVDPKEYARILDYTVKTFKEVNSDYFMMNGAFNVSAPNAGTYMDSFDYMAVMNEEVPGIFNKLDGWASHPYPQPNFSGNPSDTGRWSIRAYENELGFLKNRLDVEKDLPVFITETGWAHAEGIRYNGSFPTSAQVGEYMKIAYEKVWLPDEKVVAVTPFTIWYDAPFDHFSWVNKDKVPYIQYEMVKSLKKEEGTPQSLQVGRISTGCRP